MYHRVESPRCPVGDAAERPWAVSLDEFSRQLDGIREAGRLGVSMDQVHERLSAGQPVPAGWVAITFDDGNTSDFEHALPMLAERAFRATFFVCGSRVGLAGGLTAASLRDMHAAGMHIGSHAMTHRFLTTLSARDEEDELRRSRELLESIVGAPVDHFAPPGGRWSSRTRRALRRLSYRAVSTSAFGYNPAARPAFAYRRLPVTRATSPGRFEAMVRGDRVRLFPGYARAASLAVARTLLGEAAYGRARAARSDRTS
jgi:peptidoglycan/xylan/chitin deacetylase (PgdA/CDA1 family)